jgi:hypothetical protein
MQPAFESVPSLEKAGPPIQPTEDQPYLIPEFDYLQMISTNSASVTNSESMGWSTIHPKAKNGPRPEEPMITPTGDLVKTRDQDNDPSLSNATVTRLLEEVHSLRGSLENANLENQRLLQELEKTRKKDTVHFHQQAEIVSQDSAVQTLNNDIEELMMATTSRESSELPRKPPQPSQDDGEAVTTEELLRRRLAILEEDFYNLLSSHQQLSEQLDSERALNDHMSQELQTIPDYVSAYRQEREELTEKYKEQQRILEGVYASLEKANSDYDHLRRLLYESSRRKSESLKINDYPPQDSLSPSFTSTTQSSDVEGSLRERPVPDWWSSSSRQLRRDCFKCSHCSGLLRTL